MKLLAALVTTVCAASGLVMGTHAHLEESREYKIDNGHSAAMFRIKHLGVSYCYGRFNQMDGKFSFGGDLANCKMEIEIKADSIDSNNKQRDDHLRGPDFFNVKQFPTLTFKSKEFKKADSGRIRVTGDLTLHGVTKSVSVDLEHVGAGKDPWGGLRSGFEGTFDIKRADFGINYMPGALGDDVRILVSLEGVAS